MLLSLLLSCAIPPEQPIELDLPGEVVRERIEVTDDGDRLVFQRSPAPITDGIMFFLVVLLFPGLAVYGGFAFSDRPLAAAGLVAVVVAMDVGIIWTGRHCEVMVIDRSTQVISIRYRLPVDLELDEVRLPFSAISRVGVVILPSDSVTWIMLELQEADDTRHRVALSDSGEDDGLDVAAALRDHVAGAIGAAPGEETERRWWW